MRFFTVDKLGVFLGDEKDDEESRMSEENLVFVCFQRLSFLPEANIVFGHVHEAIQSILTVVPRF